MADDLKREDAAAAMRRINQAWLDGQVEDLASMVHPEVVMVFPDFSGTIQGRENFLAGFRDFRQNATILEFREHDQHVDVAGETAVVTFRYDMVYERSGERYRATGRDLWVFQKQGGAWIAVWRAMLDMQENAMQENAT
jgi:nuclear transport factor 2 (NTF2) superfamily protein